MGQFAHSCDLACGFHQCDGSGVDTRTKAERCKAETLAILGWMQLAHPLLYVALGVVIWQAVVQESQNQEDILHAEDPAAKADDAEVVVLSTSGLLDKAVTPWLALRRSNERLEQPSFPSSSSIESDDDAEGFQEGKRMTTASLGLEPSVSAGTPELERSTSVDLEME